MRIGPNDLLTNDPETIRKMNAARSNYLRSEWYDSMALDPNLHNILSEKSMTRHDNLRSQMAAGVRLALALSSLSTSICSG